MTGPLVERRPRRHAGVHFCDVVLLLRRGLRHVCALDSGSLYLAGTLRDVWGCLHQIMGTDGIEPGRGE